MRRWIRLIFICFMISGAIGTIGLVRDKQSVEKEWIRLLVTTKSNSEIDQQAIGMVRDVIVDSMRNDLADLKDVQKAKEYIQENIPKLRTHVNKVLIEMGIEPSAVVSGCEKAFSAGKCNMFYLPTGIREMINRSIGKGKS